MAKPPHQSEECEMRVIATLPSAESPPQEWIQIIRGEFLESPGLHLTKPQAQRLWGLDAETCETLLDSLVDQHFLRRTVRDQYARL